MKQFYNGPAAALIAGIALVSVTFSIGCANRSAVDFTGNSLFDKPTASASPADLTVRESYPTDKTWFESYENAHRESLRTGKPILAAFTGSDWCGPCIQLKKKVFDTPQFQQWATDNVVLLELDFPKKHPQDPKVASRNQQLARKYDISGYPTVLFLDTDGRVMGKQGHGTDAVKWVAAAESKLR